MDELTLNIETNRAVKDYTRFTSNLNIDGYLCWACGCWVSNAEAHYHSVPPVIDGPTDISIKSDSKDYLYIGVPSPALVRPVNEWQYCPHCGKELK